MSFTEHYEGGMQAHQEQQKPQQTPQNAASNTAAIPSTDRNNLVLVQSMLLAAKVAFRMAVDEQRVDLLIGVVQGILEVLDEAGVEPDKGKVKQAIAEFALMLERYR